MGQSYGYTSLIPALQGQRQKQRWDNFCEFETSLKEMHNKFRVSHRYTVLSYLNKQTNKYYRMIIYNKWRTAKIVNSYYDSVSDISQKYPIIAAKGKPVTLCEFQKGQQKTHRIPLSLVFPVTRQCLCHHLQRLSLYSLLTWSMIILKT